MAQRPDKQLISGLIASASTSATGSTPDLATRLSAHCWPGGSDDRNAVASEWLRRWQPKHAIVSLPLCACASGRCSACG